MDDIKIFGYNIEVIFHSYNPINLKNFEIKNVNKLKFGNNKLKIISKYELNNGHFFRGINYNDTFKNIFSNDGSFMKNGIFDNTYDLIIEFTFIESSKELNYYEIGPHHVNSYRGNINMKNIIIHKIFYNIFSEYDLTKILGLIVNNQKIKGDNPEICGIVYDLTDIKNLYICNNFFIN